MPSVDYHIRELKKARLWPHDRFGPGAEKHVKALVKAGTPKALDAVGRHALRHSNGAIRSPTLDLLLATAILIFLYGLPLGSIYVARHIKETKFVILTDILLKYFFFIILGLLTHLVINKIVAI
jgi:hypothetical protein